MLLKNGRDPGEVRPDIAHQVTPGTELTTPSLCTEGRAAACCFSSLETMPWFLRPPEFTDADGQSPEPSWLAAGLYPHTEECAD